MITGIYFALGVAFCTDVAPTIPDSRFPLPADSSYRSLYEQGITFADFVVAATARKEQWEGNYAMKVAPDALVTRATAAGSGWKLLVITIPSCGDSVNSVPYFASFLDKVPGIEMRLINNVVGKAVQEAHRTPDGRAATPTVILLDDQFNERGCWVERPVPLLAAMKEPNFGSRQDWYDKDRGASSLEEIVQMIEAAAAGSSKCAPKEKTP